MRRNLNDEVGKRLLKGLDLAGLGGLSLVASFLAVRGGDGADAVLAGFFALALTFLCMIILRGLDLYEARKQVHLGSSIIKSITAVAIVGLAAALCARLIGLQFEEGWARLWLPGSAAYIMLSRLLAWALVRRDVHSGALRQRIAIVGGGKAAEDAITTLENSKGLDIEILGLFDDRFDNRSPASIHRVKKLGKIADLDAYARANAVDLVIVAIPISAEQRLLQILKRIWELPVDIRVSGQAAKLRLSRSAYHHLGDLPLLPLFDRPLSHWNEFTKDVLDRFVALIAILLLSPVLALVALAVRLESKGPIIFKQKRFGFNNELIEVYKFRSMYVDKSDATAAKLVTKGDPRVTRVGRIIRKTSLDELPQLFNVLKGQLSLVGPRPHATQAKAAGGLYDQVVEGYFARHKVKPGITGWAQINGWRGETDTVEKIEQRVKHDLEYIDQWSLRLDLYILMKTPLALLKSENAY
ncbi:MAG: undecaprenyl-phosphate glucose phosphotransferase [Alphaproteobacteria bacterium]|nr:undecaprenyl-phosphate glucose phosphotransferase [Alphaproteobacteria bacterium]